MIPSGLPYADSVAMLHTQIDAWIEDMLLEDMAARSIQNLEEIDRMTAQYRRRLIVASYIAQLRDLSKGKVNPDSVKAYYVRNRSSMVLDAPIVRGLYVKMSENSPSLGKTRDLMKNASSASVDALERTLMSEAIQYDYFGDRWVDWQALEEQIPFRFGDADMFLDANRYFETTFNGFVYMLHIYDFRHSGDEMPFQVASTKIAKILEERDVSAVERALVVSLSKKALDDGVLKPGLYDPVTQRMADISTN